MADGDRNTRFLVTGLVALATFSAAVWLTADESPNASESTERARSEDAPDVSTTRASASALSPVQFDENGRLALAANSLPDEGPLTFAFDLPDESRGNGERTVRIVSVDSGHKIETTTRPLPDGGNGVQLEIDAAFLSPGLYMIQIETADKHPLHFRRYVLELE